MAAGAHTPRAESPGPRGLVPVLLTLLKRKKGQANGKVTAFAGRAWQAGLTEAGIASPRRKGKLAAQAGKQKIAIRDSH